MKYFICLVFCITSYLSIAQALEGQPKVDSLLKELPKQKEDTNKVKLLTSLSFTFVSIEPIEGLKYGKIALTLAKKLNYNFGITLSYKNIAQNYNSMNDYPNAKVNFDKALEIAENKIEKSDILSGLGWLFNNQNNFTKALEYYFMALSIMEEEKSDKGIASVLSNIGIVYSDIKNDNKGIEYLNKALEINIKLKREAEQIRNIGNLGNAYKNKKEFNKAIRLYEKAIELCDKIGQNRSKIINLYSIGELYFATKEFDKSISSCQKSIKLSKEFNNPMGLLKNTGLIGDNYFEKYKLDNGKKNYLNLAIKNHNEALKLSKELGSVLDQSDNLSFISKEQEIKGNYKIALKTFKEFTFLKDSIFNNESKETIKNLEDKREIELRDKEIKINKLSLEAKEKQKWYYIIGISLLGLIGGLLYFQSRKRKQSNEELQILNTELDQANKIKTRFFGILNHDLRSPVANLIHFLHLQNDNPELLDEATKKRMQSKTILGAEDLLASMEDILLWSKGQMESFKPQLKPIAVNQLFEDTQKVFSGYQNIKFDYQNLENIVLNTDENYLKTIIRNLTSNAINVFTNTPNPTILWKAYQENGKKYLSITDNGAGGAQEQFKALYDDKEVVGIKTGLGLHLIRDLAKAINCNILVNSKENVGTTIILEL